MNKKLSILIVLIMLMSTTLSCSSQKQSDNSSDNTTKNNTITFATFYDSEEQGKIYTSIAKSYEDTNPGIKVELIHNYTDEKEIVDNLSNSPKIDIMGLTRNRFVKYAKSGYLADITSYINENDYNSTLYPITLSYGKLNDKYYGIGDLPMSVEWFYNVDLFEKYNLEEPKDLEDLISISRKFKSNKIIPISLGAMDGWTIDMLLDLITSQTVGADVFTSAYGSDIESFQNIDDMNTSFNILSKVFTNCIATNAKSINYKQSIDDFIEGKAAILPAMSKAMDIIDEDKSSKFNYNVFESPIKFVDNPASLYTATSVQVLAVPNNSSKQEEAKKFLSYIYSESSQKEFRKQGYISPLIDIDSSEDDMNQKVLEHLSRTNDDSILLYDNVSETMQQNTTKILQDMLSKNVSAADAWEKILNLTFAN